MAVLMSVGCVFGVAGTTHATSAAEDWLLPPGADSSGQAQPLPRAHAHNDYEHWWPLLEALDHGFTSVEADVWLVDGELMVAHDRADVVPGRSLDRLYLSPLEERSQRNGGTIYPGWNGSLRLLIDVKSAPVPTYAAIEDALGEHPGLMTTFSRDGTDRRAVTAIISGNRDRAAMKATPTRYAGYEGELSDLDSRARPSFMPLVSADWTETFTWGGVGEMPADEEQRLRDLVAKAHDRGYRVRFWGTPDEPGAARDAVWQELVDVGVDEISTDDLDGLQDFLFNGARHPG